MEPHKLYISSDSLKLCSVLTFAFQRRQKPSETINSKMTGWRSSELIGYADLMIFREIRSEHSPIGKEQKGVGKFFYLKYTWSHENRVWGKPKLFV